MLEFCVIADTILVTEAMQVFGVVISTNDVARASQCLHVNGAYGRRLRVRDVQLDMVLANKANCEAVGLSPFTALNFRLMVKVALFAIATEVKSAVCL